MTVAPPALHIKFVRPHGDFGRPRAEPSGARSKRPDRRPRQAPGNRAGAAPAREHGEFPECVKNHRWDRAVWVGCGPAKNVAPVAVGENAGGWLADSSECSARTTPDDGKGAELPNGRVTHWLHIGMMDWELLFGNDPARIIVNANDYELTSSPYTKVADSGQGKIKQTPAAGCLTLSLGKVESHR